ncbi:MAG: carbohydrate-binding family 9-like protein [Fimbriimonadaceae bacterium]|nr:carbohydrate-binding family 9-like protein [Fimbriimonadaceae bacterium]
MRTLLVWFVGLTTCAAVAQDLPADQVPPLPELHVARAARPPAIDGSLSPGEWEGATPVNLTYWWDTQTGPRDATVVRLMWDDVFMYVAYDCVDHDLTAIHQTTDDPTYQDDCCEIFVQPNPAKPLCYVGFEMNCRAVMYDYCVVSGANLFTRWNASGYWLQTRLDGTLNQRGDQDRGFQLEVAIPLRNFSDLLTSYTPRPGDRWRAQLCRWNGTAPDRALCLWSHSGRRSPDPHAPARFGTLIFDGAP